MAGAFELDIRRFADKVKARADVVIRKISLDMFSRIVLRTPTDTGRARANWQLAVNAVPDGVLELDDKAGTATISKASAALAGVEAGDTITFVNAVPYAGNLEYGHSKQSPAGMVRVTIEEFQSVVNGAVRS